MAIERIDALTPYARACVREDPASAGVTPATGVTLRPYQREALDAVLEAHARGDGRALLVLPTGCGKTVIFNTLIATLRVPTVILAHREELLVQARDKLLAIWPDADVGIVGAGYAEAGHQITIGSVQSLSRPKRLATLTTAGIRLLVVDEAHHAAAESYRAVLRAVRAGQPDHAEAGGAFLLGVTATPDRADGKSIIDAVFGAPVYQASLPTMIRAGYLVNLRGVCVRTTTRLDGVNTRAGDFAEDQLAAVVNVADRNAQIVQAWQRHAPERLTLVFCANVEHAHDLADAFRAAGIAAEAVDGETPRNERHAILARFATGKTRVLCNCAVLTEGFDHPAASCVVLARPTQSRALYVQCIGRGTRPAPGKTDCLVLDVADVSSKHRLVVQTLPRLVGQPGYVDLDSDPVTERRTQATGDGAADDLTFNLRESLDRAPRPLAERVVEHSVNLLDGFEWQAAGNGDYSLPIAEKALFRLHLEGDAYRASVIWPDGYVQHLTPNAPVSLDWAQTLAERAAIDVASGLAHLVDDRQSWRLDVPSWKQLYWLKRCRIPHDPDTITKGEARDLLNEYWARHPRRH